MSMDRDLTTEEYKPCPKCGSSLCGGFIGNDTSNSPPLQFKVMMGCHQCGVGYSAVVPISDDLAVMAVLAAMKLAWAATDGVSAGIMPLQHTSLAQYAGNEDWDASVVGIPMAVDMVLSQAAS